MLATTTHAGESQWSELPPDLLRDISGRLHATVDFVRFHAVCRPWRETVVVDGAPKNFLPWLLAPSDAHVASADLADQRCHCVFSRTSCRAPGICIRDRRVACADGTAAWLVGGNKEPRLVNPLTAAHLAFPTQVHAATQDARSHPPRRLRRRHHPRKDCPDHEPWMGVSRDLGTDRCCAAVYNHGDVVCSDLANCYIL
ncbi:hypothetical protein C2845_PM06G29050 [Panicum miliaceum]|uniref:F-box domain-containing protein n=1 Tax=Panicum miliaceum TaxID=4540 RepID=A0A3L6R6Y9_PANMI|nr:hypothetical protein C2845_PM06G29050 [Panicum miliaceum]